MENHEISESLWMIDFEKNEFVEYPNKEMIYHLITITIEKYAECGASFALVQNIDAKLVLSFSNASVECENHIDENCISD